MKNFPLVTENDTIWGTPPEEEISYAPLMVE
jgi:hypothetical protein